MKHQSNVHPSQANALIDTIVTFINDIGIPCREATVRSDSFLPGVDIKAGEILFDPGALTYPGDLLHEAGHIAVLLPNDRATATSPDGLFGDIDRAAGEMAAIAWSWAALKHLDLEPGVIFHEGGYKGGASALIDAFSSGKYIGSPTLQWLGMTKESKLNVPPDKDTYPVMKHWLRPEKKLHDN